MRRLINIVLVSTFMVTSCFGSSQKVKKTENVFPRVPSSICKSFTDKTGESQKETWCDYFDNPQSHPCTEVSIDKDSVVMVCYYDPSLPTNPLAGRDLPSQKGGLVATVIKEKDGEAILAFKAYTYVNGSWLVSAESEGRLLDGMGENSYYLSSGRFTSAGVRPGEMDEQITWTIDKGETTFSRVINGKPRFENCRNEEGGYDRWYYEDSGKIRSEIKYKAVRDYDRLFGEEFVRYEVVEKSEFEDQ